VNSLWRPFEEPLRHAIVLAQQEAEQFGGGSLGTEHLLLGIIAEGESPAAALLDRCGMGLDRVRESVGSLGAHAAPPAQPGELVFTANAKLAIERCFEVARTSGTTGIGTEHMLAALARLRRGGAHSIFESLLEPERLAAFREEADRLALGGAADAPAEALRAGVFQAMPQITDAESRLYAACLAAATTGDNDAEALAVRASRLYRAALATIAASRNQPG